MDSKQIRNFCIISHIDHGKSTLADRFLELTGTVEKKKMRPQYLDMMDLEREKGITIKLKPVRMELDSKSLKIEKQPSGESASGRPGKLKIPDSRFILNLVDTPGHVDFSYEVSRSLAAVEGAILLVDASKGIQAQTIANLELTKEQNLIIIPVVNKIDLPQANIEKTVEELVNLLRINKNEVIKISAKYGTNVSQVLEAIIKNIPAPKKENLYKPFRALIFDSEYDSYKGVIVYVRVVDGRVKSGEKIKLFASQVKTELKELGYFKPEPFPQNELFAGEIGYIATGIKEPGLVRVGDTVTLANLDKFPTNLRNEYSRKFVPKFVQTQDTQPLPGYKEPKPVVFASFYPENPDDFDLLKEGLSKLKLNDPSLIFEPETKAALGRGFKCGFLGTLHVETVSERLRREFNLNLIISTPSVVYKIICPVRGYEDNEKAQKEQTPDKAGQKNKEIFIYSASDWHGQPQRAEEPWVSLEVITPTEYIGRISEILKALKGNYIETKYISSERIILIYELPLREIITNLYDKIKSATQGYGSMNYKILGFRPADLVKLEILIAGEKEEALSKIVPRDDVYQEGKKLVKKLKSILPPQQFSVALQAAVGEKIIARETIRARRKDVTGYLYGGDYTRKRKLLEKQKKGKKKLKENGKVRISPKVFLEISRI